MIKFYLCNQFYETLTSSTNHIEIGKEFLVNSKVRHCPAEDSRRRYLEEVIGQLVTAKLIDGEKCAEINSD